MKNSLSKKILSLLLAVGMVMSGMITPLTSYAADITPEQAAEKYLKTNYIDGANKVIRNGGDSVVKSKNGLSYEVGLKTPSGGDITTLLFKSESSRSEYKSVWYINSDSKYVKSIGSSAGRCSIESRPTADEPPYKFTATLKLFDKNVTADDINNGVAKSLAEQNFEVSLAQAEKEFKVTFEAVDSNTDKKIDSAQIKVRKDFRDVNPGSDGNYTMKSSEVFTVTAEAKGYKSYKNTSFNATKDGLLQLKLDPSLTHVVKFDVKDSTGKRVNDAKISVKKGFYDTVKPEVDGSYKLEEGTKYNYTVSAENYSNVTGTIDPKKDETISVVLQKNIAEYTVRFEIKDKAGISVENAKVSVTYQEYDDFEMDYVTTEVIQEKDGSYKLSKGTEYDYNITASGYPDVSGKINPSGDNETIVQKIELDGGVIIDPADQKKVDDAQASFDKELGALRPKFSKDKNINTVVLESLEARGVNVEGLTVEVVSSNNEDVIGKDGIINYVKYPILSGHIYFQNVTCSFKFKAGNAEATTNKSGRTVTVCWDQDFFFNMMNGESEQVTIDKILNGNKSEKEVTKDLSLPQSIGTSAKKVWSKISWESSNPEVINIVDPSIDFIINPCIGKVKAQPEDKVVRLTATFEANEMVLNSYVEKPSDFKVVKKTFDVTVKGTGEAKPTEEELMGLLDKYYTVDELTYSVTGKVIDPKNVNGDIRILRYTKITDETGNFVFKNKEITVTTDNDKVISINGYRASVDIFTKENPDVNLLVNFTRDGVSVTKKIPLHVKQVTDKELDEEIQKMNLAKKHYFDGINDGNFADKNSITGNLHSFQEMRVDSKGQPVWVYDSKDFVGDGIVPDDFFEDPWEMEGQGYNKFKSSNIGVVKADNLLVSRQETSKQVTISSLLSSAKYGKFAKIHPENKKLQKLYKQLVEVTVTVKGTKSASDGLSKVIVEAKDFLDKISEGTKPGEYKIGTRAELEKAVNVAETVLKDQVSTEQNYENATAELQKAIDKAKESQNSNRVNATIFANPDSNVLGNKLVADVAADEAKKAGYAKPDKCQNDVTVIDALVVMHRNMYGEAFDKNPKAYLEMGSNGWISKIFGKSTMNLGFMVNDKMPKDSTGMGTMANDSILKNNDTVNIFVYGSDLYDDMYLKFAENEVTVKADESFVLTVNGFVASYSISIDVPLEPQKNCKVVLKPVNGQENEKLEGITDENGQVTFAVSDIGKYIATVEKCDSEFFIAPYLNINVERNDETEKKDAKSELESYKNLKDYRETQQKEIKDILADNIAKIDAAKTTADIEEILKAAKAELDNVKTDAQLTEEENNVAADKVIILIDKIGQVNLNSKEAIDEARAAYNILSDGVKVKVINYDKLVTAEKKYEELLAESEKLEMAKKDAKAELESYKNLKDYKENQQKEIKAILADNIAKIDAAKTTADIEEILKAAKAELDKIKVDEQITEEENKVEEENNKPINPNSDKEQNKDLSLIPTGDYENLLMYSLLLFGAFGGIVVLRKKRNLIK
ncbi:MAG: hypothetical protein SO128_02220 [Clostridium cadaveris]|uniref:hypothetical protein n=1 Tax=Clostridium cadaveris TaxID=1529 RepID=UPI002A8EFFD6|nr:hypothetical protein [Clostridium cadaveris]